MQEVTQDVIDHFEKNFQRHVDYLKSLVRIPSVSFEGFPKSEVRHSAEAVASLLKKTGLENVKTLEIQGAHPYVYGEWLKAPGRPTLLLYAHHDVQPPGRTELWLSPPFEPTLREGPGGQRLFGRGTADDKAGIIVHTATIASFLETQGKLPINVKVIIEGEEETGSSHLKEFVEMYQKLLQADALVLTDAGNFDIGVPALTIALRGMVAIGVEVRALTKSVHSGMWGGPLPDPVIALTKILAQLVDEEGRIAIPGVREQVRPLSPEEEKEIKRIPYNEAEFRLQSGLIPQAKILQEGPSPMGQLWRFPALTINAFEASSKKQAGNIINDAAWAKVSIRLVPDMDPQKVLEQLKDFLQSKLPWGLELNITTEACAGPWSTEPKGVFFDAAVKALTKGYGKEPLKIGCGGSIPFVAPLTSVLGDVPALLVGVEDPYTNAHGENESLLLEDFKKACLSEIYLFTEVAERVS